MIDICITIFYNYDLLDLQIKSWLKKSGNYRLLICDNTPIDHRQIVNINSPNVSIFNFDTNFRHYDPARDGESHGSALDFILTRAKSDIVGICDSDFFWLDDNILHKTQKLFDNGCQCYGTELWYNDFEKINNRFPDRAGWLAPCVFGMFVDRELAMSETFISTAQEGRMELRETGWRLRKKIIENNIKNTVIPACKNHSGAGSIYYGDCNNPIGFHWLKGIQKVGKAGEIANIVL